MSASNGISPRNLIIDCLSARRRPDQLERLADRVSSGSVDWDSVWTVAASERVAPLLYHTTRHHAILPEWLLLLSREAYLEAGLLNTLRLKELSSLLNEFAAYGIEVILLKGAALVERTYGNIALRPMVDVDLLVRRDQVRPALKVLELAGYQTDSPEITPDAALDYENELLLSKKDRLDWVTELHWSLFDSPFYQHRLPEATLWASASEFQLDGQPARVLSPELELLHLCGHLTLHHRGQGLLWWNDIAEVIHAESPRIDWDRLLALATDLELVLPIQTILPNVTGQWAAPIPPAVLDRLAALTPSPEETRVYDSLTAGYRPPARRLLADLQGLPGWNPKARFLVSNLFPSAAYMDERYNITQSWLRPFYYPYRWYLGISGAISPRNKKGPAG